MGRYAAPRPFLARVLRGGQRCAVAASAATPARLSSLLRPAVVSAAGILAAAPPVAAQLPVPVGTEVLVNTTTYGSQTAAAVGMDASGGYVIVWESEYGCTPEDDSDTILGQRFAADGTRVGAEFCVNSYTSGSQTNAAIAVEADGSFTVVWKSGTPYHYGIYGRRYTASGVPEGPEFNVNGSTTEYEYEPAAATNAAGDLVVVWRTREAPADADRSDVYARVYAPGGAAVGEPFRVNTYTTGFQRLPGVAVDADGGFVVVWQSTDQDGDRTGVYAQRYAALGVPVGEELRVNTETIGLQSTPAVAMDEEGDWVVVWTGAGAEGGGTYARCYEADGSPKGPEHRVDVTQPTTLYDSAVAADPAGGFIVAWSRVTNPGVNGDIIARRLGADGALQGDAFSASYSVAEHRLPALAIGPDGAFVLAWEVWTDGSAYGIIGRRYRSVLVSAEEGPDDGLAFSATPSPVEGIGRLRYTVPEAGPVRLVLYDALGREVAVLAEGAVPAGTHEAVLDAAGLTPGVYVVRLTAGADVLTRRLTVAR